MTVEVVTKTYECHLCKYIMIALFPLSFPQVYFRTNRDCPHYSLTVAKEELEAGTHSQNCDFDLFIARIEQEINRREPFGTSLYFIEGLRFALKVYKDIVK